MKLLESGFCSTPKNSKIQLLIPSEDYVLFKPNYYVNLKKLINEGWIVDHPKLINVYLLNLKWRNQ